MITNLGQEINEKKSKFLEVDLNEYLVNKNQITEYVKRKWFKGSRYR